MLEASSNYHASHQEPLYGPYYADKEPMTTTLRPLVAQLSGSLA
jgi:hypothetical protein